MVALTGNNSKLSHIKCPFLWWLAFLLHCCSSAADSLHDLAKIQFDPSYVHDLAENHNQTVFIRISFNESEFYKSLYYGKPFKLYLKTLHDRIATTDKSLLLLNADNFTIVNGSMEYEFDARIDAHLMGKTALELRLASTAIDELLYIEEDGFGTMLAFVKGASRMELWVRKEKDHTICEKIFVLTLIILIFIANILMGCEIDLGAVLSTIKSPIPPAICGLTQFILMPLLACAIAHVILLPRGLNSFALGLFVTGCSPSGGASNFWTILLEGNVNLSITMTFISTLASIGLIPFWMKFLGHKFLQGFTNVHVKVPYTNIFSALLILIVPLLIGTLIAKFLPQIAAKARKILRPFVLFVLIFIIIFGTILNLHLFKLASWPAVLSGLLLPWCGFMFGCFFSLIFGQKPENVTTIAIETGVQNTGIAIMLLKFSFEQPDSDISALIPVIVACFTPFPVLFSYGIHNFIKYIKNRNSPIDIEKEAIGISFDTKNSAPFTMSSKVQDGSSKPLIRQPIEQLRNASFEEPLIEEERIILAK